MTRLAILTVDDDIWALACWARTIPVLKNSGYDVAGIWFCPDRLGPYRGRDIGRWYGALFGQWDCFRLGLFHTVVRLARMVSGRPATIKDLCRRENIFLGAVRDANDPAFVDWVRRENIDILLIMVADIIKPALIGAVGKYIVNRHDGLLPANRGLFPNVWAAIMGQMQGVTFHVVTEKIDQGRILYQERVSAASLTGFALDAFGGYHRRILKALAEEGGFAHGLPPSYQGLPLADDIAHLKNQGGALIRWRDFLALYKII